MAHRSNTVDAIVARRASGAGALALALLAAPAASAQSLNVDFGLPADAPSSSYAAAGLPGVWNSIEGQDAPETIYPLVGLDGTPTGVTLHNIGGTDLLSASDPSVSGDDGALLNDALLTFTSSLETCLFVDGLEPGTYEVLMYAWMPSAPGVRSRVRHDLGATTADVGGAWTGAHVEGVTFARHVLVIGADGFMGSHSGIVPGMPESAGAALDGFQLRLIDCPGCPDAGPPAVDAGTGSVDAATAATDAGAIDAGTAAVDGGMRPVDGGARTDAGMAGPAATACGCRAPGRGPREPMAAVALLVAVAVLCQRRARASGGLDAPVGSRPNRSS